MIDRYGIPLWYGLLYTILIFAGALAIASVVGITIGLARLSKYRVIRFSAIVFIEVFRGTSALVQLFWVFYVLPLILGISIPAVAAGWIVIGLNQGSYMAEVVRSAIQAVPTTQIEACIAVNLGPWRRWRRVVIPQALPIILPPYGNHVISILKETAIVSLIGISDLTFSANQLRTRFGHTDELFLAITAVYLLSALGLNRATRGLERRFAIPGTAASRRMMSRDRTAGAP